MIDGLVRAARDRSAIWLGKAVAVLAFLVLAELVALPAFALFFTGLDGRTIAGVALADIGICTVGTLLAGMAASSHARELLLPLLFLPLVIPVVIGGVGSSVAANPARYLGFLALYDAVFALVAAGLVGLRALSWRYQSQPGFGYARETNVTSGALS